MNVADVPIAARFLFLQAKIEHQGAFNSFGFGSPPIYIIYKYLYIRTTSFKSIWEPHIRSVQTIRTRVRTCVPF